MKKLVYLLLLAGIATGQAQVIQLDEARVEGRSVKISINGDDLKYAVVEDYKGQFHKNPIAFMKEKFDIHSFIEQMRGTGYDSFLVEFRNRKGYLEASFDGEGNLLRTSQKFKNIALPIAIARELVTKHNGWTMKKNLYLASGKGDALDNELYRITMKNGKRTQNVKIIPDRSPAGLVSN